MRHLTGHQTCIVCSKPLGQNTYNLNHCGALTCVPRNAGDVDCKTCHRPTEPLYIEAGNCLICQVEEGK